MIPTPQPYSNPRATPPPPPPRRRRRTVLIVVAVAVVVLIVAAVGFAVSVFGLNSGFVALIGAVILFGLISFALRFLPQGLPGIRLLRSLVGFVTIAALAGILYFFFVPAAQSGFRSLPELGGPATSAATTPVTVVYDVTGTAPHRTDSVNHSVACRRRNDRRHWQHRRHRDYRATDSIQPHLHRHRVGDNLLQSQREYLGRR